MQWQSRQIDERELLLQLGGALTVENAEELCRVLRDALAAAPMVRVELATDSETDLAGLQLFCAAHRSSLICGGRFSLQTETPENFRAAVRAAGLPRPTGCTVDPDNQCLWLGERYEQDHHDRG